MSDIKIAKVKPEIAPEVVQALRTLRFNVHSDEMSERVAQAIVVLDNAGVFAAIDAESECTCPRSRVSFPTKLGDDMCTCTHAIGMDDPEPHNPGCPGDNQKEN